MGAVFSMDMGSPAPQESTPLSSKTPQPAYYRSVSAPSAEKSEEQIKEERRQENNLALKRMLQGAKVQQPEAVIPGTELPAAHLGSPLPKGRQPRGPPSQNPPRNYSTSPALSSDSTPMQRQAALRALAERQIPTSNGQVTPNTRDSCNGKETPFLSSTGIYLEAQKTPAAAATLGHSPPSANTRSRTRTRHDNRDGHQVPIHGLQNLTIGAQRQDNIAPSGLYPATMAIENDLRRILKMEVLGSDGASGVRS